MKNKNDIINNLNIPILNGKRIDYKLSYSEEVSLSPNNMDCNKMLNYLNKNYKCNEDIDRNKLLNDLITFKSYKDNLEIKIKKDELFSKFISDLITIFIGLVALFVMFLNIKKIDYRSILMIYGVFIVIVYVFYFIRSSKKYYYEYLNGVNIVIHTLEEIKTEIKD